jgi:hypothetical protein
MPTIGESATVYGNSQGSGLITKLDGHVLSIGPTEIEVDIDFVQGNSGSPIINRDGYVMGIATYATKSMNYDWITEGTRFEKARRFGTRLDIPIAWNKVSPKALYQQTLLIDSAYIHLGILSCLTNYFTSQKIGNLFSTYKNSYLYANKAVELSYATSHFIAGSKKYNKNSFTQKNALKEFNDKLNEWVMSYKVKDNDFKWHAHQLQEHYNYVEEMIDKLSFTYMRSVSNLINDISDISARSGNYDWSIKALQNMR